MGQQLDLPNRKLWPMGIVFGLFFAVFAAIWYGTFRSLVDQEYETFFDALSFSFHGFWLLGWSVGTAMLGVIAVLLVFHDETARIFGGGLYLIHSLGPLRFCSEYGLSGITNLRYETNQGSEKELVQIYFDYWDGRARLGDVMAETDARRIIETIEAARSGAMELRRLPSLGWRIWEFRLSNKIVPIDESRASTGVVSPRTEPDIGRRTGMPGADRANTASSYALIAANIVPLFGVFLFDWELADVMILYWAESAVIGVYNVIKIFVVAKWAAIIIAPFFTAHYGGFMAGHLLFIYGMFVKGMSSGNDDGMHAVITEIFLPLWPALLALFLSHGISFYSNFLGRKEYLGKTAEKQMMEPYKRIIVMHITIIFGGFVMMIFHVPVGALALLVILKTCSDLAAHRKEHRVPSASAQSVSH